MAGLGDRRLHRHRADPWSGGFARARGRLGKQVPAADSTSRCQEAGAEEGEHRMAHGLTVLAELAAEKKSCSDGPAITAA